MWLWSLDFRSKAARAHGELKLRVSRSRWLVDEDGIIQLGSPAEPARRAPAAGAALVSFGARARGLPPASLSGAGRCLARVGCCRAAAGLGAHFDGSPGVSVLKGGDLPCFAAAGRLLRDAKRRDVQRLRSGQLNGPEEAAERN